MNKRKLIKKFWGVNEKKINLVLSFVGINCIDYRMVPKNITKNLDLILSHFINQRYGLKQQIKNWVNLKLIKGIRRTKGLPVNGQNIKRNGKTQKKLYKSRLC